MRLRGTDMRRAGGIIGLISGIFGTGAAIVTLFVGGLGTAFEAEGARTVVGLRWSGLAFAFLTIVLGAVTMATESKIPAILLIASALVGAIAGGTLVAICMVLALIGGVLALFQGKKPAAAV
jgi:hypothetical protein